MQLLDLPPDVFQHVIAFAIPAEASDLDPGTFRARRSTVHLQLVNDSFYREVRRQLFLIRPLQIKIYDNALLHDLTSGHIRDLSSIKEHMRDLKYQYHRLSRLRLRKVPLHHFRRINIHLIPLLAQVNVGSDLGLHYFKASWPQQPPWSLTAKYEEALDLQHHMIREQARAISQVLEEIERVDLVISSRQTSLMVFFHDSPENVIPSYLLPNTMYTIPGAPVKQLSMLPHSATSAENVTALFQPYPTLPTWSPSDVLQIIEYFNSIGNRDEDNLDPPHYPTFEETIRLPSTIACLHHDNTKSTSWHHNYWRQRFRHCFTHFEDAARNIDLGADSLQNWYDGRTNVRPKGWATPPDPTRTLPCLVLQDLHSDNLETQGCVCIGGFMCCVKPERSGCKTCPVCHGERSRGETRAYEVLLPTDSLEESKLARRLLETHQIVQKALAPHDFDADDESSGRREFVMEQKAMYYIASDWQAELLTKAIPRTQVVRIRKKLQNWLVCFIECKRASNERGSGTRLKWVENESEMSKVEGSDEVIPAMNAMHLSVDANLNVETGGQLTPETKHVMDLNKLGDEGYAEDVAEARIKIRSAIENFTGATFDEKAVRYRLMNEVHEQLSRLGRKEQVRSRVDDSDAQSL